MAPWAIPILCESSEIAVVFNYPKFVAQAVPHPHEKTGTCHAVSQTMLCYQDEEEEEESPEEDSEEREAAHKAELVYVERKLQTLRSAPVSQSTLVPHPPQQPSKQGR